MGDRLQRPGNERVILIGRYADQFGTSDIRIVRETPGRFRLDLSDKPNRPLIYDDSTGWSSPSITQLEAAALESLFDDTPDSFFYEVSNGSSYRFLGNGFRANDLGSRNSNGTAFDVYQLFAAVRSPVGVARRGKEFFFDSQTGLLGRVQYLAPGNVRVVTEISNWQTASGQSFPGTILRKENSSVVLNVALTNFSVGRSVADGTFNGR